CKDAFAKKAKLVVSDVVNQTFNLDRIMSEAKFIINDRIPFDATRISIGFFGTINMYDLYGTGYWTDSQEMKYAIKDSEKGEIGLTFSTYLVANRPGGDMILPSVSLIYLDDNRNFIGRGATIEDVRFEIGK